MPGGDEYRNVMSTLMSDESPQSERTLYEQVNIRTKYSMAVQVY